MHPSPPPPTTRSTHAAARRLRRSRPVAVLAALLSSAAFAPPAHAEFPLVGVLTGGELRSTGSGTIRADEVASDFVYDPATSDICAGDMCNDRKDLTHHAKAQVRWDTTWLVDARYPGVPADPKASPNAIKWNAEVGSWTVRRTEEDYQFPNDQGDGGHDQNPVREEVSCDAALVARMPEGTESPLLPGLGSDWGNGFDAGKHRSFQLNAFGSTMSTGTCGETDRQGYWGPFGLVPVEGDAMEWDLGTGPREEFRWTRRGRLDKTVACDPKWTDGTPRDTETQCAQTTDLTAENTLSCALCVTDVRYDQHPQATAGWDEVPFEGTYDGNEIRITVRIENRATKTLTVPLLMRDKRSGRVLEGPGLENPKTYTFLPGSTTDIEVVWKTDGFAWEGGAPASERDIQFLTPYGGAQQRIIVKPRPVVLVHGWNSDASAWEGYSGMLAGIHPNWKGYAVGDGQFTGTMDTSPFSGNDIKVNATAEHLYIEDLRRSLSADHVDLVVHSMGGLISRQYLHANMGKAADGRTAVRRLVMLGTPNQGSPCADLIRVAARGVPTQQLTTGFAKWFNGAITNRKGVPFSIIAGNINERTCSSEVQGDGVVEVPSALWTIGDFATTFIFHTSMTGDAHLLTSFVRPRLALDPSAVKKLATQSRVEARSSQLGARTARVEPEPATAARAAGEGPVATRAALRRDGAPAKPTQAVGTADVKVAGSKTIAATFGAGAAPGFAFLAPAGMAAELVDPKGKVAATQPAGSPGAQAPVRWLSAAKGRAGRWSLRLKGTGQVVSTAVATGGRQALVVTTKARKKGGFTISAKLRGLPRGGRGAKVRATVQGAGGKPAKLTLEAGKGGYRGTLKAAPAGAGSVVVTATLGKARLSTAADLG